LIGPWPGAPHVFAGRDLVRGGTWLGIAQGQQRGSFKFAVVHNYRHYGPPLACAQSRGDLVLDFIKGSLSASAWASVVEGKAAHYNGFTLILMDDKDGAYFVTNRPILKKKLAPGLYGLCNASLDTPWPKLTSGKQKFETLFSKTFKDVKSLARSIIDDVLKDRTLYAHDLPGVLDGTKEISLSSIFIEPFQWGSSGLYGTRTHTVVVMNDAGFHVVEETLDPKTMKWISSEVHQNGEPSLRSKL